jgi:hypothetical protein
MADATALSIIDTALSLARSHPGAGALALLDLALAGHHRSAPDFADRCQPGGDWTDPRTTFGQLLAEAFAPTLAGQAARMLDGAEDQAADAFAACWQHTVVERFAARYALWPDDGPCPGTAVWRAQRG